MTGSIVPSLVEIESALATPADRRLEPLRIAVLREITVEPLDSYLRYLARRSGLDATVTLGDFGRLAQEAIQGAPFLNAEIGRAHV